MSRQNIERVFAQVDDTDYKAGRVAYANYNKTLRMMASAYGTGFVQTVAAFVALSPNNDYMGNIRSLKTLIIGWKAGNRIEDLSISTYNACKIRAWAYLRGERDFLMDTRGPKTRAFYHNILAPTDTKHVTIDGHMMNIYIGEVRPLVEVARIRIPYDKISAEFKIVARKNGLIPSQLQAMLWFTWKRINKIVYSPQLALFNADDDRWGLKIHPVHIKIFGGPKWSK